MMNDDVMGEGGGPEYVKKEPAMGWSEAMGGAGEAELMVVYENEGSGGDAAWMRWVVEFFNFWGIF